MNHVGSYLIDVKSEPIFNLAFQVLQGDKGSWTEQADIELYHTDY